MTTALTTLAAVVLCATLADQLEKRPVRVTVLVVLAKSQGPATPDKLVPLATEVQKREPELKSFRQYRILQQSLLLDQAHTFELPDQKQLKVCIEQGRNQKGQVILTIRPPGIGDITYECVCGKFLPVVTPHVTPAGERLILAIMASPCLAK